jgi:putative flippase GtrA
MQALSQLSYGPNFGRRENLPDGNRLVKELGGSGRSKLSPQEMRFRDLMAIQLPQMLRFALVGVVGFVVDAATLYVMAEVGIGIRVGRLISYLFAVTTTWALNRRYTFRRPSGYTLLGEWARFCTSQLAGATVNLGVYYLLIRITFVANHPVIGVAAGSLSGLLINFMVAKVAVYRSEAA